MIGGWEINVQSGMPQKLASAFGELSEQIIGAEYYFVYYLGAQVVNGTNHAVLAEQVVTTGKDSRNVVILIFNEKPEGITLVGIDRILESGGLLGGTNVDVHINIPDSAMSVWNEAFEEFVGAKIEPLVILGTQVANGTNYFFVATLDKKVVVVVVNDTLKKVSIADVLGNRSEASLGYSFTW